MRAFIGIDLTDSTILSAIESMRTRLGAPQNTNQNHITLAFLDDIDQDLADRTSECLDSVEFEAFEIKIATLGAFPSKKNPRIVWVGVQDGLDKLTALADSVYAAIEPLGFLQEHKFVPHVTIFRVKSKNAQVIDMLADNHDTVFGVQLIDRLSLKRSDASSNRHIHTTLRTVEAFA